MTPDDVNDQIEERIADDIVEMDDFDVLRELHIKFHIDIVCGSEEIRDSNWMDMRRHHLAALRHQEYSSRY